MAKHRRVIAIAALTLLLAGCGTDDSGSGSGGDQVTTFDNGFAGFWVPSDIEGTTEVFYEGKSAFAELSTTDNGATCITDLRLS